MQTNSTLQQMATELNLSMMSVSRALRGDIGVSEATRRRVVAAARARGYRPNAIARALVTGKTQTLAVLLCEFHATTSSRVLAGVEEGAREAGYKILLSLHQRDRQSTLTAVEEMTMYRTDGIVSISSRSDDLAWTSDVLRQTGRPFVTAYHTTSGETESDAVIVDHRQGVFCATRYLIEQGRRNIAFAGGPSDRLATRERYEGYLEAHHQSNTEPDPRLAAFDEFNVQGGLRLADRLFTAPRRPDAVIAANDDIAAGILRGCRAVGLSVPADISVVAVEAGPICEATDPPLTAVVLPLREVGLASVKRIIDRVESPSSWRPCVTKLPCHMVIRQST